VLQTYVEELNDLVRGAEARPDEAAPSARHSGSPSSGSYTPSRKNEFFVPIGDVFAPMQDADYFDGYKVRNVASGVFLQDNYFTPVGIDVTSQVWLTNLIKCFLFHQNNVDAYQELGWTDVPVRQSYSELLPAGQVCSQWISQEVQICDPKLVLTVGKPPCVLPHNVPIKDSGLQSRVYNALLGVWLPANDARIETGVARTLHLTSKYPPPFPIAASRRSPSKTPRPVSIVRLSPWKRYNMFHMMHPQAVMMSQTSIVTTLQQAIQLKLGPKAKGLSYDQLDDAITSFLEKHKLAELIAALPYGQRDVFQSNATLLETQAVTLAELADTLVKLGLTPRNKWTGARVLAAQARALVKNFHLADSAAAELKRLQKMRDAKRAAVASYRRAGGRG
jgi:hypothetical protein